MVSSEQLERQTEQSRAEVELTIDELRARLTPGQIVDEIMAYSRGGAGQFVSNLGRQVTNNPLPVALMGAGLAWFLLGHDASASMGRGFHAAGGNGHDPASGLKKTDPRISQAMQDAFGDVRRAAESAGSAVSDTAHNLGEAASAAYHTASSKVNHSAVDLANSATAFEQKTMRAARDLIVQAKEQPLILVGIGLAIGAAMGAALPTTDLENRVMGGTADEVKRDAKQMASEQLEKTKGAAHELVEDTVNGQGDGSERAGGASLQRDHFG
jgi:ElaB/YqjD/DUF883 family membrane-anchored ribosome-binding protein